MFISVWQGGNRFIVANNDCMVRNLLDYLRSKLEVNDENVVLDLADEEGNLQLLPDYHPRRNATKLLQAKTTYIPVAIERNDDGSLKPFRPLVKRILKDADFMKQLQIQYERRCPRQPAARSRLNSVKEKGGKDMSRISNAKKSATALKGQQVRGASQRGKNTK